MSLYNLQVPVSSEFGGHSIVEEIVIAMANNHANVPLPSHQETLLQFFPYLSSFTEFDRKWIVKDVYDPSLHRADVIRAISDRGSRRRSMLALRGSKNSIWNKAISGIKHTGYAFRDLTLSAKVRSVLWYTALMYATDWSLTVLVMQLAGMLSVMLSFNPKVVTGPRYLFSATLSGFRFLLDYWGTFETSSASIITGAISGFVMLSTIGINHFIFAGPGFEYLVGLVLSFFAVTGFIWLF